MTTPTECQCESPGYCQLMKRQMSAIRHNECKNKPGFFPVFWNARDSKPSRPPLNAMPRCWEIAAAGIVDENYVDFGNWSGTFPLVRIENPNPAFPSFGWGQVSGSHGRWSMTRKSEFWDLMWIGRGGGRKGWFHYRIPVKDFDANGPNVFSFVEGNTERDTPPPTIIAIPMDC